MGSIYRIKMTGREAGNRFKIEVLSPWRRQELQGSSQLQVVSLVICLVTSSVKDVSNSILKFPFDRQKHVFYIPLLAKLRASPRTNPHSRVAESSRCPLFVCDVGWYESKGQQKHESVVHINNTAEYLCKSVVCIASYFHSCLQLKFLSYDLAAAAAA